MASWRDFPLPDGSYSDETRPWSQQDVVNYLPTIAERNGTRSPVLHKTAPGLKAFARIGDGPHRGAHNCEGRRFVVSGRKLYQVDKTGAATELGTIPGTGRVTMAHNQIANGNQVLIGTVDNSYLWDTTTSMLAATGVALQSVDFLNQRFLGVDQQRRFWRHSALADGTSWNDLDVYSSESSPDRIVGLKVLDGQVYVFNERTIEVFVDQPTETQVYQRSVVIQRGCISGDSIVRIAGTLFFVGDDYIPYRLDGYTPVPIGTKPITSDLSGTDPRKLFGFGWEDRGYLVYYITAQNGHTWGYDVTNGKWHRRESYGLDRWRINTLVKFEQDWYAGDYASGLMYRLEWGYVYEGCEIMPRKLRTGVLHNQGNRVRIHGFRLFSETGRDECLPCDTINGPVRITGDLPDGSVGAAASGAYTITGGIAPYGPVTVIAGSLPTGVTLSPDGSWSGTYAAAGTFAWTVRVTDAIGGVATLEGGAQVGASFLTSKPYPIYVRDDMGMSAGFTDAETKDLFLFGNADTDAMSISAGFVSASTQSIVLSTSVTESLSFSAGFDSASTKEVILSNTIPPESLSFAAGFTSASTKEVVLSNSIPPESLSLSASFISASTEPA